MFMQLLCRHKCRHRVINHCKVCSVSVSNCSQRRQLGRHTQDSSLCTAQLRVEMERTQNSSLPLLFRPFPGLLPTELSKRYSNKRPPCPEGRGPVLQPHSPVQRGHEVLPHLSQAAPQGCCDGRLRGLAGVVLVAIPSKKFLDKIPAQGLAQLAKIMPAKFWPRSYPRYGKISASWQDLGKNLSQELFAGSWRRSCPVLVGGWELTVEGWGTVA